MRGRPASAVAEAIGRSDPVSASLMAPTAARAARSFPAGSDQSCLLARWTTASAFSTPARIESRSSRSLRRTAAPSFLTTAADSAERARPVTSCPLATRSATNARPMNPEVRVTKMRTMLSLVVVMSAVGDGLTGLPRGGDNVPGATACLSPAITQAGNSGRGTLRGVTFCGRGPPGPPMRSIPASGVRRRLVRYGSRVCRT
jgi:hypothetical protein